MKKHYSKFIIFILSLVILSVPLTLLAAADLGLADVDVGLGDNTLKSIIINIINIFLGLLGIIAIGFILYAGFVWMTAGGSADKIDKAKKILIRATIGLVIILSAFAIVSFVINSIGGATGLGDGEDSAGITPSIISGGTVNLVVNNWQPYDGAIGTARNIMTRVYFNKIIDASSVAKDDFIFTKLSDNSVVNFELEVIGSRIDIQPLVSCEVEGVEYCLDSLVSYQVAVNDGSLTSVDGKNLVCTTGCSTIFTTSDYIDLVAPTVSLVSPQENATFSIASIVDITAQAEDDSGVVAAMTFLANNTEVIPTGVDGAEPWEGVYAITGYDAGDSIDINATAEDLSGNIGNSGDVTIRVLPEHCFNQVQDGDETGIDCGGSCGGCLGDSCDNNISTDICETSDSLCGQGMCNLECVCALAPVIYSIAPNNGAPGNYTTISGEGFGSSVGSVVFLGTTSSGDEVNAKLAACSNAWSPAQVIVEIPDNAVSGSIKLITSSGDFDTTLDERGWQGDFIINLTVRPGICSISPEASPALSKIIISGTQFGDTVDNVVVGGIRVSGPDIESWGNSSITTLVPNIQPGRVSVAVVVGEEISNPVSLEVVRDILLPSISYLEPDNGPIGQYVTIHGNNFGFSEADILVNFINGSTTVAADVDFPAMCGDYSVENDEILVRVPVGISLGLWSVVVDRDQKESNAVEFNVTEDVLSPGLCLLEPNNGPVGTIVDAYGEGFGTAGQFIFYNNLNAVIGNWSDGHISSQTPINANTGPVKAVSGSGGISNSINFSVGSCDANSCSLGDECCSDGICREVGNCEQSIGADEYIWSFTTGQQLSPFIIEDAWPVCADACLNAMIGVQFSNPVDLVSLNDISIDVKQCTDDNCSAFISEIEYTAADVSVGYYDVTNYILNINPAGNLQTESYYRVILKSGSLGIVNEEGGYLENVNYASTGGEIDSYSWTFMTGVDECTLDGVEILPVGYTIYSQNERLNITGYPFSEPDTCSLRGQRLDPVNFVWNWQSTSEATATVVGNSYQGVVTPVWGHPGETSIVAKADGVAGSTLVTVDMDIPRIDSISPDNGMINANLKTYVTIHGANFGDEQGSTAVLVGGVEAEVADCDGAWSNTQIVVEMPLSTSTGDTIRIIKTGGDDESDPFTVNNIIRPALCSIDPVYGIEEMKITLSGYNFGDMQNDGMAFFDQLGVSTIDSWLNTKIKTRVPTGAATGPVVVNVLGNDSNSMIFSMEPYITKLIPNNGSVNSYTTIIGGNFGENQGDGYVMIGNQRAYLSPCFGSWTNTSIKVQVPTGLDLGSQAVQVITHYGVGSNEVNYEVNQKPANPLLCDINPNWAAANESVLLSGYNFGDGTNSFVLFSSNVQATTSDWSNQAIIANISEYVQSGPVSVTKEVVVGQQCAGFHIGNWCPGAEYEDIVEQVVSNTVDFIKGCVIGTTSSRDVDFTPAVAENSEAVGTLATDGKYIYGKSWSSYDMQDNTISIIGSGYGGTVLGQDYGDLASVSGSITMTYYPDGFLYNSYSAGGHSLQSINVSSGKVSNSANITDGLLNRNTGETYSSARGDNLITSDGTYIYNLAFGTHACPDNYNSRCYDGFKVRVFDPNNGWSLVREWMSGDNSFYTDGIVADGTYIYAIQWGGSHKIRMMDAITGEFVLEWISEQGNGGSNGSGNDIISGQYDWVNDRVWLGDLVDWDRAPGPAYMYRYNSCHSEIIGAPPNCGDGMLQLDEGEQCDDGNIIDGDGCSSVCVIENTGVAVCNNNILDVGEACDFIDGQAVYIDGMACDDIDGFSKGSLSCSNECTILTDQCEVGAPTPNVCINTEISAEFDSLMNWQTFIPGFTDGATVHFEKVTNICESGDDVGEACTSDADCMNGVCDLDVSIFVGLEDIPPNDSQYTKLYIYPAAGILEADSEFRVTVKGGLGGVQDVEGYTLASDYVWPFYTGDTECIIQRVEITPSSYQFNNSEEVVNFTVHGYDDNNNTVVGAYSWEVQGDAQLLAMVGASSQTVQVSATGAGNGELSLRASVYASEDSNGEDNVPIDIFMCNVPWIYENETFNFKTRYCRGKGINHIYNSGFENDDNSDDVPDVWTEPMEYVDGKVLNDYNFDFYQSGVHLKPNAIYNISGFAAKSEEENQVVARIVVRTCNRTGDCSDQTDASGIEGVGTCIIETDNHPQDIDLRFEPFGTDMGRNSCWFRTNEFVVSGRIYLLTDGDPVWFDNVQLELGAESTPYEESNLLPSLSMSPNSATGDELLNILFLQSDYNIPDAIGMRVFTNFDHISPLVWYQDNVQNIGNPKQINVGGYSALQEGRTTYVNAANSSTGNVYTNIFVLSYTQDANSTTQDIFSQMYNNWTFNSNMDSYSEKEELVRDTHRWENMMDMAEKLNYYYRINADYPDLSVGTYLAGTTVSVWDSWQGTLGAQLNGLPVDPINSHVDCSSGYDSVTCWNPVQLDYFCPMDSHVYKYDYVLGEYSIYSNFEYDGVVWKGTNDLDVASSTACDNVVLEATGMSSFTD